MDLNSSSLSLGSTQVPFEDTFFSDDLDPKQIHDVKAPTRPLGPVPGDPTGQAATPLVMRRRTKKDKTIYNPMELELLGINPKPEPKSVWEEMVDDEDTWKRQSVGVAVRPTPDFRPAVVRQLARTSLSFASKTMHNMARAQTAPASSIKKRAAAVVTEKRKPVPVPGRTGVMFGEESSNLEGSRYERQRLGYAVPITWFPTGGTTANSPEAMSFDSVHPWHKYSSKKGAEPQKKSEGFVQKMRHVFSTTSAISPIPLPPMQPDTASLGSRPQSCASRARPHTKKALEAASESFLNASRIYDYENHQEARERFLREREVLRSRGSSRSGPRYRSPQKQDSPDANDTLPVRAWDEEEVKRSTLEGKTNYSSNVKKNLSGRLKALQDDLNTTKSSVRNMTHKQESRIIQLMDTMPLSFLLNYHIDSKYVRQRVLRIFMPAFRYIRLYALYVRFHRWRLNTEAVSNATRTKSYRHGAGVKILLNVIARSIRDQELRRKRRAMEKWKKLTAYYRWLEMRDAILLIQRTIRGYNARVLYARMKLEYRSATKIQAMARAYHPRLWWKLVRTAPPPIQALWRSYRMRHWLPRLRKAALPLQTAWRRAWRRKQYKTMRRAAITIAAYVRRYLAFAVFRDMEERSIREFEIRYMACIHMQRVFRGFSSRSRLKREKAERDRELMTLEYAAVRVQRQYYRRNGEFSAFCLMCALRTVHGWEMEEKREEYLLRRWMLVFRIQTMYRRFFIRKRLRMRKRYNQAVLKIKKWMTGIKVRNWFREHLRRMRLAKLMVPLFHRFSKPRHAAARTIQRFFWWSHLYRMSRRLIHKYYQDRREDAIRHYLKLHTMATHIQNICRMYLARREYLKLLAAIKITSVSRGFFARRFVRGIKRGVRIIVARKYLRELFRRMVPRVAPKLWWKRMQSASKLQKLIRSFLRFRAMLRAQARAKAAQSVQRFYQGMQGRRLYRRAKRRHEYNLVNVYRDENGVALVLVAFRSQTKSLYDPYDDTVGLHFAAWLRRLGVLEYYHTLKEHGVDSAALMCRMNDHQLELAGVESEAARNRIIHFFTDGGGREDGSAGSYPDFAFATYGEAMKMMTRRFPKAGMSRARNFASMAGGHDITYSAIKAVFEKCTDPQELRPHIQNLIGWKMKSKSHLWDVKRVTQYLPLANMAIWRIIQLEGSKGMGPELLGLAEQAEMLWRREGDNDVELSPEEETLRLAGMTHEDKIKAAAILGSGIVLAMKAVDASTGVQRIYRGLKGRRRGLRLLEIERRRQRLIRLERERLERERLRHEAEMEALRQQKIQELLAYITRFGWTEYYDEEDGTYFLSDVDASSVVWTRPLYLVPEYDSAARIQIYIRRFQARRLVARMRWDIANTNLREKRQKDWDKKKEKRSHLVLLQWDFQYLIQPEGPTAAELAKELKMQATAKEKNKTEELALLTPLPLHTSIVGRMVRVYFPHKRQDKEIENRKVLRYIGRVLDDALRDAFLIIDEHKAQRLKQKRRRKNKRGKKGKVQVEQNAPEDADEEEEEEEEEEKQDRSGTSADNQSNPEENTNQTEASDPEETEANEDTEMDIELESDAESLGSKTGKTKRKKKKKKKKKQKKGFATNGKATSGEKKMIRSLVVGIVDALVKRRRKYRARLRKSIRSLALDIISDATEFAVEKQETESEAKDDAIIASRWRQGVISVHQPLTHRHLVSFFDEVQVARIRRGHSIAGLTKTRPSYNGQPRKWNADSLWLDFKDPDLVVEWLDEEKPAVTTQLHIDTNSYICRFGWEQYPSEEDPTKVFYWNEGLQMSSWDHPDYEFFEVEAAESIQRVWRGLNGRRLFRYLVAQQRIDKYLEQMVARAASFAWYGFGLEGMSPKMYLTRLGFGDDLIEDLIALACSRNPALKHSKKIKASKLSLNRLKAVSTKRLMTVSTLSRTDLNYLQLVCTTPEKESEALALIVSETTSYTYDSAGIQEVMRKGPKDAFNAEFRNQELRCHAFIRKVLDSLTPVAYGAAKYYLRKFTGKARAAVDRVEFELANRLYVNDRKAVTSCYFLLHRALEQVALMFGNMKLPTIQAYVRQQVASVQQVTDRLKEAAQKQAMAMREAKRLANQAETKLLEDKAASVPLPEPKPVGGDGGDGGNADNGKKNDDETANDKPEDEDEDEEVEEEIVRVEREWVQEIMDGARSLRRTIARLLYIHYLIIKAQAAYRGHTRFVEYNALLRYRWQCSITIQTLARVVLAKKQRDIYIAMRDSPWEQDIDETREGSPYFYFNTITQSTSWTPPNMPFKPYGWWPKFKEPEVEAGVCSECKDSPGVRYCNDCERLFCFSCYVDYHSKSRELRQHTFRAVSEIQRSHHLKCVEGCGKMAVRWCKAEEEAFCRSCYLRVHQKGTRAKHRWLGYPLGHPECVECEEKFAVRNCQECNDKFCVDCYKKVHCTGKRRKHKYTLLRPKLHAQETYCSDCDLNIGRNLWIDKKYCQGCFEYHRNTATVEQKDDFVVCGQTLCETCGRPATRRCKECNTSFCSRRVFGNPGCYEKFHYPAKRWHTWEEHPRVRIDAALIKIQPFIRGYFGRKEAHHRRRLRALEVVKNAFMQARRNKTARQILDRQRADHDSLLYTIRRKAIRVKRKMGFKKKNKRVQVLEAVEETWDINQSVEDLQLIVWEQIERFNVPEDRRDFMHKSVCKEVRSDFKRRLKAIKKQKKREAEALKEAKKKAIQNRRRID